MLTTLSQDAAARGDRDGRPARDVRSRRLPLARGAEPARAARAAARRFEPLVQRSKLPQLNVKLLFRVGSAHDPKGKEGLAALAAAMIADAGSQAMTIDEIKQGALPDGRRASTRRSTRR